MSKLIAVALVSFVTVGVCVQKASAWLLDHRCCANICCRQYNAFSPFVCEGPVCNAMPGHGYGGLPTGAFPGGHGYPGELPPPGMLGEPVPNGSAAPPAINGPVPGSPGPTPADNPQAFRPGTSMQPWPVWGPGMMNPSAVPGPYPGFTGYGIGNGNGVPFRYPGLTGYGPANGYGR